MENSIYIDNTSLAFTIVKKLVKIGTRESIFPFSSEFSIDELNQINDLTLISSDSLEEIEKLNNLKSLCIIGDLNSSYSEDNCYEKISELKSLEKLHIIDVDNIYDLDVENLSNLKSIRLINNSNLSIIKGISSLKKLKEVIISGNDIKEFDDAISYIENTSDVEVNILDVNMFDKMFGKNSKNRRFLESKINSQWSNIKFGEMLAFNNECYTLEYYQMSKMHTKAIGILNKLKLDDNDDMEKATKIYTYIVNNLSYNYEGLENRDKMYYQKEVEENQGNEYFKRRMLSINSSYSAIMEKKSVCDGYVNMMKLLLNMCDINSKKVLCSFHDIYSSKPDHVIIKFKIDDNWYYADPEKEQSTETIDYFPLNIEEIQKTHFLPIKEIETAENNKVYRK